MKPALSEQRTEYIMPVQVRYKCRSISLPFLRKLTNVNLYGPFCFSICGRN